MDPPRMQELSLMEQREETRTYIRTVVVKRGLFTGHNGICASTPHQVIGLEWPPPSGSEEAGLASCAIIDNSSISLGTRFTSPAGGVKMVTAGEAEASAAGEQLAKE